jgi:transposase
MKPLVSDEFWTRIAPGLPSAKPPRFRFPGRRPLHPRHVLTGIIFVLETGLDRDDLPAELGWGCGKTCRASPRLWQRSGVWQRLHEIRLTELQGADRIDWSRALVDGALLKAPSGGDATGPDPTDRRKLGSQHHIITDAQGIPLATRLTMAKCPLEGEGEKQVALRRGLSRHTIHEYVTVLDHRLGVNSRPELRALCLRHRRGADLGHPGRDAAPN